MNFAIEFSKLFLDSQEKAEDIQSRINLHNNYIGRMVIQNEYQLETIFLHFQQFD